MREDNNYGWTEHSPHTSDNDFGKYRKVVVHGSCHSRCMMLDNESDWKMLKLFEQSKSILMNVHRELWKEKNALITDMSSIIDQAKFLGDVEQYWTNVRECVNFDNTDIGRELSIVSEQTKTRLSQAMNNSLPMSVLSKFTHSLTLVQYCSTSPKNFAWSIIDDISVMLSLIHI